jgi:hypothetical protein
VTIPIARPSLSTTTTALIECARSRAAAAATVSSGVAVTTGDRMMSANRFR